MLRRVMGENAYFSNIFLEWYSKEFMVQLQTFTTSDYLLKNNCFDNN